MRARQPTDCGTVGSYASALINQSSLGAHGRRWFPAFKSSFKGRAKGLTGSPSLLDPTRVQTDHLRTAAPIPPVLCAFRPSRAQRVRCVQCGGAVNDDIHCCATRGLSAAQAPPTTRTSRTPHRMPPE